MNRKNIQYFFNKFPLTNIVFFLYSTGTYNGKVKFGDAGYYLKKQLFASVLGMIAFWVMARIDYHRVAAFATVLYLCSIALSTAVLFVGRSYNGSKRWLALGPLSFQPAEFAKAAVILFLSFRISNRKKRQTVSGLCSGRWRRCYRLSGWWEQII